MVLDIVRSLSLRGALGFATLRGLRGHNRGRCILKLTEVIKGPSRFGGCNTHCCWRLSCLAHFITRNSVRKIHIRMVEPIRTTAWKWAWMAFHSGMYENVALQVANRAEGPAAPRTGVIPHLGRRTLPLSSLLSELNPDVVPAAHGKLKSSRGEGSLLNRLGGMFEVDVRAKKKMKPTNPVSIPENFSVH